MRLTEEQKKVVRALMKNRGRDQVQTLGGYAGTGKTTVMSVLAQALPGYSVCAFTGKAANVLRRKGIANASTIHSLIYRPYTDDQGRTVFSLVWPDELKNEGFLVDEGSMVPFDIDTDIRSFGRPVIYVGDHGQLEPVNSSHNLMADPMYRLETVHRNAGEIAHFAEHLRKGQSPWKFETSGKVQVGPESEIGDEHLLATDQIICAYNRFRVGTNARIRHARKHKGLLVKGEKVMCLKNNKKLGIFNGMQGTVVGLHGKDRLDFESDGETYFDIEYDPEQFGKEKTEIRPGHEPPNPFDYAYCVTCHKAQGDEWDNVLVYEQKCDRWEHKRWAYTAASRAKHGLIWLTPRLFVPGWLK